MDIKIIIKWVLFAAILFAVWYFVFRKDSEQVETVQEPQKKPYKPGQNALDLKKWGDEINTWEHPTGVAGWWMVETQYPEKAIKIEDYKDNLGRLCAVDGNKMDSKCLLFKNEDEKRNEWYKNNERFIYGWFKGMDLNPNNNSNGGAWKHVAKEIKKYMNSSSKKDFDEIIVGEFLPANLK